MLNGEWGDAEEPLAAPAHRVPFVRALVDAGLLPEADIIASLALERGGDENEVDALTRMREKIKDAVDPNGIISAGRYGVWPRHLRDG